MRHGPQHCSAHVYELYQLCIPPPYALCYYAIQYMLCYYKHMYAYLVQSFQIFHFTHFAKFIDSSLIVISFLVKFKMGKFCSRQPLNTMHDSFCMFCGAALVAHTYHVAYINTAKVHSVIWRTENRHETIERKLHCVCVCVFQLNKRAARKRALQINKLESNTHKSLCAFGVFTHASSQPNGVRNETNKYDKSRR